MKIHILTLALCLVGFAACGDDDGNGTGTDATVDATGTTPDATVDGAKPDATGTTPDADVPDATGDATVDGPYYTGDPDQCDGLEFDTSNAANAAGGASVGCFGSSGGDDETFRMCISDAVEAAEANVTDECGYCYGVSANCGSDKCLSRCIADPSSDDCVLCRCEAGCFEAFDTCSGFSTEGDNCSN